MVEEEFFSVELYLASRDKETVRFDLFIPEFKLYKSTPLIWAVLIFEVHYICVCIYTYTCIICVHIYMYVYIYIHSRNQAPYSALHWTSFRGVILFTTNMSLPITVVCGRAYLITELPVWDREIRTFTKFTPRSMAASEHWLIWLASKLSSSYWRLTFPLSTEVIMKGISD